MDDSEGQLEQDRGWRFTYSALEDANNRILFTILLSDGWTMTWSTWWPRSSSTRAPTRTHSRRLSQSTWFSGRPRTCHAASSDRRSSAPSGENPSRYVNTTQTKVLSDTTDIRCRCLHAFVRGGIANSLLLRRTRELVTGVCWYRPSVSAFVLCFVITALQATVPRFRLCKMWFVCDIIRWLAVTPALHLH